MSMALRGEVEPEQLGTVVGWALPTYQTKRWAVPTLLRYVFPYGVWEREINFSLCSYSLNSQPSLSITSVCTNITLPQHPKPGDSMSLPIQLEQMTLEEKLHTMEILWDDLCRSSPDIASPTWHQDVLNDRETAMQNADDSFVDWDIAKKNIRNELK